MKISKLKLGIAMAEKGFNFQQLAEASEVSRTTLSYVNNGKTCKPLILHKIAKALEVEPEYLIE